jgi:hypothetical protein
MKIRLLYFQGCPSVAPAKCLLKQVLADEDVKSKIQMIEIKNLKMAAHEHFLGSPTIQIDGKDIEKERFSHPASFGCRLYNTEKGLSGIPPLELIRKAVQSAKKS